MACGENPKRVYGGSGKFPSTRMGNAAAMRAQWAEAVEYQRDWNEYDAKKKAGKDDAKAPKRDLRLDTLVAVLKGELLVHNHCYRAEEMAFILDMAREFGYHLSAFHHATEAYKIADLLARENVCAAMWADWWGFKMESYDAIPENVSIVDRVKNGCAILHSDSEEGIQHLNQEAGKVMARAKAIGWDIRPEHAVRWITLNPAKAMGIDRETGSLSVGKMGDVVVWNRNPFSSYALAEQVLIDGALVYDRSKPVDKPVSDFLLGQPAGGGTL
jgi:imidazolonepropionase-like amidohydrolase